MTPEDTLYFEEMEKLVGMPGWGMLVEDSKRKVYQFQADALEAKSWEEVKVLLGRAIELQSIIDLKDLLSLEREKAEANDASV